MTVSSDQPSGQPTGEGHNLSGTPAGMSVVICCYNSAARLPDTLRHLAQVRTASLPWEVIVVDNASTDGTAEIARQNWPADAPAPLRVVAEPQPGLSHARRRGVTEVRYEIISFIDDDNWVPVDWIEQVLAIFDAHPEVGACGGRGQAVTEIEPPAWFEGIRKCYATGSQHDGPGDITDVRGTLLWGAGLNVRTAAIRSLFADGFDFRMSGRSGSNMGAGEDTEMCCALREAGWHFWYDDTLVLRHFIPKGRLTWSYALRLLEGIGHSTAYFDLYLMAMGRAPFDPYPGWKKTWLVQWLKSARLLLVLFLRHPVVCLKKPEGSTPALQFQSLKGRLALFRSLAGRDLKFDRPALSRCLPK